MTKTKQEADKEVADPYKLREDAKKELEAKLGMVYGEPIFSVKGLTFKADGYEGPYITVSLVLPKGQTSTHLNLHHVRSLLNDCHRMLEWCEKGYAPGAC